MRIIVTESVKKLFDLTGRVAVITGGAGMLGLRHGEAIAEMGGIPVLVDLDAERSVTVAEDLQKRFSTEALGIGIDITQKEDVVRMVSTVMERFGHIDILINNAALTMKGRIETAGEFFAPFEEYPLSLWEAALQVNLTGAFLITQAVGKVMVKQEKGVIVNIASDIGVISPDHRIYEGQPFNTPIAYPTTKAGIISFTRYLATYWAKKGIRVNAISPAGVYDNHDPEFVRRLTDLIPLGRMAHKDEYKGAILFLVSDASSFMTGANLIVDGGRTCW